MEYYNNETWYTEQFIKTPPNPIQRNTELRAKHAVKKHLANYSPTHKSVIVAKYRSDFYKLDGHTRALLWQSKKLVMPKKVHVTIYKVNSIDEIKKLYLQFDNSQAQETANDRIFGAMNGSGLVANSTLLNYGGLTTALQLLDPFKKYSKGKFRPLHELVPDWISVLKVIEEADFKRSHFVAGLIMAMLLTVRKDPESISFWLSFVNNEGSKSGNQMDGVQRLITYIESMKFKRNLSGHKNAVEIADTSLRCYEEWKLGNMFKQSSKIKPLSCFGYRNEVCVDLMTRFEKFKSSNPGIFEKKKPKTKTAKKISRSVFDEDQISLV